MIFWNKKINSNESLSPIEEESEEYRIKKRLYNLGKLNMVGAKTIKEIKQLEERLEEIQIEKDYHKWFNNNKPYIEDLFATMKQHFLTVGEIFELLYTEDEKHLKFKNYILHRDFLVKLLHKYDYYCYDYHEQGKKIKMEIKYNIK